MNLLKVKRVGEGMHPREVIVQVETKTGPEQVAVFDTALQGDNVVIGYPLDAVNGHLLVQLPNETARGVWRVWVSKDDVSEDVPEGARA